MRSAKRPGAKPSSRADHQPPRAVIDDPMPDRPTARALPVLDVVPPRPTTARGPVAIADRRVEEYRPEAATLPSFAIWTLGCQMNRSDSEEMAGRLLAVGCAEAPSFETADLVVINTCAIREAAEQKVIGRQGQLARLKAANPGLRVVLTGCAVRERDRAGLARRFPAVDLFLRPDEEPELVDRLGLASAQGVIGAMAATGPIGLTTVVGRTVVGVADRLPGTRATAVGEGTIRRSSPTSAWLPIVYGCDKTCTYCIVPFSRGPERSRPFDEIVAEARSLAAAGYREVTLLGQNVNSYGHDLPAEERFSHIATERWSGRRLDLRARPDLAELIRAIDGLRTADGRPAIPRLRFVTSHPWDLSDRLVAALAECTSVCQHLHLPVQSGDDGVLHRMGRQYTIEHYRERLAAVRAAVPGIAISTDVIVGFCGETEAQFEATLEVLRAVGYDQVFAAAFSSRPGTPAAHLPDDVPAVEKRRRLNTLLDVQEGIGLERNRAWLGRTVEVLVDAIVPPRSHDHEDEHQAPGQEEASNARPGADADAAADAVHLAGRSRENKLVHLIGPATLLGSLVTVRVDHAGPYALRGALA
jgi:tRNA-2-methylthio-N6-dimethylallyladenosine synthase